ncbi:hypothetical protein BZG01_00170 [Labilibaculum manganireducens]|uniref:Terminase ATPase subunit N-terminal domain-containing protein n=1 Tax=Labilibaculum manganireducens TaxID=1940525 RepID=A0A2N3IGJ1_9BACT|nr:response regulator transcription factor [Labilibaculum manganireducens]PKQ69388.1 hypothetical protein BZG01_00170 [Labilibaculum manganireducens]
MELTKKAAVELLFKEGYEQKQIAKMLKLSEATVSKYVTLGGLRKKRLDHSIKRNTSEENALSALSHQTTVIRMISEKLGADINDSMTVEELGKCLIPKGEIDAVQKLFTTVKGKELDWSAIVKILREFSQWLKEEDLNLAQDIIDPIDKYLNEKRKSL